jgi:hypothetical protein
MKLLQCTINIENVLLVLILYVDPGSPYSVMITNSSTSSLTIQWKHDGGVDRYTVSVNGTQSDNETASNTSKVIRVEKPGALYCIVVTAVKGGLKSSSDEKCSVAGENQFTLSILLVIVIFSLHWLSDRSVEFCNWRYRENCSSALHS